MNLQFSYICFHLKYWLVLSWVTLNCHWCVIVSCETVDSIYLLNESFSSFSLRLYRSLSLRLYFSNSQHQTVSVTALPPCLQHITLDSYIPCLTDLCKALWEVMLSYHRTMQWHEAHDKQAAAPTPGTARCLRHLMFDFYVQHFEVETCATFPNWTQAISTFIWYFRS